jgi:putative ABC transport system permease protein
MTGLGMVSVAIALCAATELLSRAKEAAVAAQIDHMGPTLRLIPAGQTAYNLARFELGPDSFTIQDLHRVRRALSPWIRALDARLLSKVPLQGRAVPAIGIDPGRVISPFEDLAELDDRDVALGATLGHELESKTNNQIFVNGTRFRVAAILPETASPEDLAVFLPLGQLQSLLALPATINEIRVFPASRVSIESIIAEVKSNHPEMNVINTHRGDTAEHEISDTLVEHRRVLYAITALVVGLCIFIWSYLSADERKVEIATVVAIGGTAMTILSMLVARAAVVGLLGGVLGYLAGASIAVGQDLEWALGVAFSSKLVLAVTGSAVVVSILGASAGSIPSMLRRHTTLLQEWS